MVSALSLKGFDTCLRDSKVGDVEGVIMENSGGSEDPSLFVIHAGYMHVSFRRTSDDVSDAIWERMLEKN